MTHVLEPSEKLFSAEYWGVDIDDSPAFEQAVRPGSVTLSGAEQRAADDVLGSCLVEIVHGDFVETDYHADGNFAPGTAELSDGTVLILDREHLTRHEYFEGSKPGRRDEGLTGTRVPRKDLSDFWLANQPDAFDNPPFSEEVASVTDENTSIHYLRSLQWGVLVTHEGQRAVATWAFSAPSIAGRALSMPRSDDMDIFRRAEVLPLAYRQTVANPDFYPDEAAIALGRKPARVTRLTRSMDRLKAVKIIHAATAEYNPADESSKFSKRVKDALGGLVLPKPDIEQPGLYPI